MVSEWLTRREYAALLSLLDSVEDPTPEENAIAEKIRGIVARMRHRGKRGGRNRRRGMSLAPILDPVVNRDRWQ